MYQERTKRELRILESAKKRSAKTADHEKTIIKGMGRREFFRFEKGNLVEYEASHLNGQAVDLTDEEKQTINRMEY